MEDKGTQTEREGRLLTGFGGPCPTAVSGPAAHPRISLRRGLLCGSGPADLLERLTDNGPGGGGVRERGGEGGLSWEHPLASDAAAPPHRFISVGAFFLIFFYPNREARSHDVSVESRSACRETLF